MKRLLLMGPPGAGKGTQASYLAEKLGVPAISTGDIFRAHVSAGTSLGTQAQAYMDAGEYVPDEITNNMVAQRLRNPDATNGFLLDGYPRTLIQVAHIDDTLATNGHRLDAVLLLEADTEELVSRLVARAAIESRADDNGTVVRRRQEIYAAQTAPLVEEYRRRGILVTVDGTGTVETVRQRILASLSEASSGRPMH